jgi:hypothetical protein
MMSFPVPAIAILKRPLVVVLLLFCSWIPAPTQAFIPVTSTAIVPRKGTASIIFTQRSSHYAKTSRYLPSFSPSNRAMERTRGSWQENNNNIVGKSCLFATKGDNGDSDDETTGDSLADNFDAKGFGGYLAPYALALIASVLVTGAFVKFVLLDY